MEIENPRILITISTVDGRRTGHHYDAEQAKGSVLEFVRAIVHPMSLALSGKVSIFPMKYPTVIYNASHVVSIQMDIDGPDELQDEAVRTMGFPVPSS